MRAMLPRAQRAASAGVTMSLVPTICVQTYAKQGSTIALIQMRSHNIFRMPPTTGRGRTITRKQTQQGQYHGGFHSLPATGITKTKSKTKSAKVKSNNKQPSIASLEQLQGHNETLHASNGNVHVNEENLQVVDTGYNQARIQVSYNEVPQTLSPNNCYPTTLEPTNNFFSGNIPLTVQSATHKRGMGIITEHCNYQHRRNDASNDITHHKNLNGRKDTRSIQPRILPIAVSETIIPPGVASLPDALHNTGQIQQMYNSWMKDVQIGLFTADAEKSVVNTFVKDKLFRAVKFVDNSIMADTSSNSLAALVSKGCHLDMNTVGEWWPRVKEYVNRQLNLKRTNCNGAMKDGYISKLHPDAVAQICKS
jgi:hypothetical protein